MSNPAPAVGNFCLSSSNHSARLGHSQHHAAAHAATRKVQLPGVVLQHLQCIATIVTERCRVGSSQTAAPIPAAVAMTQCRHRAVPSSAWHFPSGAPKALCKGEWLQFPFYRAGTRNTAMKRSALLMGTGKQGTEAAVQQFHSTGEHAVETKVSCWKAHRTPWEIER